MEPYTTLEPTRDLPVEQIRTSTQMAVNLRIAQVWRCGAGGYELSMKSHAKESPYPDFMSGDYYAGVS
jgi:hypothetical protein